MTIVQNVALLVLASSCSLIRQSRLLDSSFMHVPTITDELATWDPVAINHTRWLKLDGSGKLYKMKTLAMRPPIFEIEDFLTDAECDDIKKLAGYQGLKQSETFSSDEEDTDANITDKQAERLVRHSDQTWLANHAQDYLSELQARVQRLTRFPDKFLPLAEDVQVVQYGRLGHYQTHYDSEDSAAGPCCQQFDEIRAKDEHCRHCRFATILYYLQDVEEGGGTVFPLADVTVDEMRTRRRDALFGLETRHCRPGLAIKPKKGKAVLWYNHRVDRGYLGPVRPRSAHGGCNVYQGQKWIANHWLSALPHPDNKHARKRQDLPYGDVGGRGDELTEERLALLLEED